MFERTGPVEPGRGRLRGRPRPGLTTGGVVAAGRRVIERDGLDALTMRAVAAELGTAPTSLYRHVTDRDALLLAILEQIAAGLPVEVPGGTPRARLLRRLLDAHAYMADHVWVLHILIRGEMVAERALAFNDACLADFLAAGLAPRSALAAFRTCWQLVLGELFDQHPLAPPREPNQRQRAFASADPVRLPALARCVPHIPDAATRHDEFTRNLGALLTSLLATSEADPEATPADGAEAGPAVP
ncbi:TetR/AcrR family transcriptional regulator [Peterkaempfera bronchialis]|uniref:TetR/AcrR family transcriptional regulator n=1 Tax=Peterkaempfera bronchialis TaxID=2126346 RepID=UPI003C2ED9EF